MNLSALFNFLRTVRHRSVSDSAARESEGQAALGNFIAQANNHSTALVTIYQTRADAMLDDAGFRLAIEQDAADRVESYLKQGRIAELATLQPHIDLVAAMANLRNDHAAARLSIALGKYRRLTADYDGARQCLERAQSILGEILDPENPETAVVLNELGSLLHDQGRFAEARTLHEQSAFIRTRLYGLDNPETLESVSCVGGAASRQGDSAVAERVLVDALVRREAVLGTDHADLAFSANGLGMLLLDRGDLEGARRHLERALRIRETRLGTLHPSSSDSAHNLATALRLSGEYGRARELYEQALDARTRMFGDRHPASLKTLHDLAALLRSHRARE
jgi:tetratricopeptide (TPR) repeat protein